MKSNYFNPVKIIDSENWFESWQIIRRELGINKPLVIAFEENVNHLKLKQISELTDLSFTKGRMG